MTEQEEHALRLLNQQLIGRLAAACEVLARKSNRLPAECPCCGHPMQFGFDGLDMVPSQSAVLCMEKP